MALDRVIPDMEKSFGTLVFHKRHPENDVFENSVGRTRNRPTEICYEVGSSVQEGSVYVMVPAQARVVSDANYNKEIILYAPYITMTYNVKNRGIEGTQANAQTEIVLHAKAIQVKGDNK